jgi:hypothetical protein
VAGRCEIALMGDMLVGGPPPGRAGYLPAPEPGAEDKPRSRWGQRSHGGGLEIHTGARGGDERR